MTEPVGPRPARRLRVSEETTAAVVRLLRDRPPSCGPTRVVAVDGRSGSGKTTLGRQLADALGATLVHMDDLYQGWDGLAEAPVLLERHLLGPLARGEPAAYPSFDWVHGVPGAWRGVAPCDFLIIEGAGSSAAPAAAHLALALWLDARHAVRRRRALHRDGDAYRPHWERWAAQERALFARDRPRDRADVVIDTTDGTERVQWRRRGPRGAHPGGWMSDMTDDAGVPRVVSASREIAAGADRIFELIADPALQPRWDGNDNLAEAAAGQRVRRAGEVFRMTLTGDGAVRENHVVEFDEGRRIAWRPAEPGQQPPGHLWRWELEPIDASRTRVTHTYDWSRLTDEKRLARARATDEHRLRASLDRLAAEAEGG